MASSNSFLPYLRGPFRWMDESEKIFDQYKDDIDTRIAACDIMDDRTRGRLTTACAWVLKLTMIFEAAALCYDVKWRPPNSPELHLRPEMLKLAMKHVEQCLIAAAGLNLIANRKSIAENAQMLLAYVRTKFAVRVRNGAIILTRSELTDTYAHNASRGTDSPVGDIYDRYIPYLISVGDAKLITKEGKKETYAFCVESP